MRLVLGKGESLNAESFSLRTLREHWFLVASLVLTIAPSAFAQEMNGSSSPGALPGLVARWNLHMGDAHGVAEELSGTKALITGTLYQVRGPVGDAVQFDEYTGALHSDSVKPLINPKNVTIVCWLRLDAYPWNELPILDQEATGHGEPSSFFFGVDAEGHLLARLGGNKASSVVSASVVPLRTWSLVTLAIDRESRLNLTIGGRPSLASESSHPAETANINGDDLWIGRVRKPLLPGPSSTIHPQFPIAYSLDGALGALSVYGRVLSESEIDALIEHADKSQLATTPWPKFPRGEGSEKQFGAFYTTLHFDPTWDRSRRVAPDSDVVVTFDDAPTQLVFWQGNNYVPAWVTENNRWYTDEFMETYGYPRCPDGEDCEPMSDKQVRYSHVRILESTPARVVVHWRYALSEVEKYGISNAATPTDWGDWADEYWTIYPDGIAVRKSVLWSTASDRDKTEFQESIVLIPPGETPEDNLNFDALTFGNLLGETHTYRWEPKTRSGFALPRGPEGFPDPKDAVIQWVNLKSEWKPFQVAWGEGVKFVAYNGERSISSFEWWNHWPVAQIASSGRPALAADRAGHTSLSHIYWPIYEQDEPRISKILLDGLTRLSAAELAPIAASWRNPARLELSDGTMAPYDPAQRAYVLPAMNARVLRLTLHASATSLVFHPAFVVLGWPEQDRAAVQIISGADSSVQARIGYLSGLTGKRLVAYLPIMATGDVVLELRER